MTTRVKILIVSTKNDPSLRLFFAKGSLDLMDPSLLLYSASPQVIDEVSAQDFDYIYFRDPFNVTGTVDSTAKGTLTKVLSRYKKAYKVDGILSFEDIQFEDKWLQYQGFKELMPETRLYNLDDARQLTNRVYKKRISSRSKDIWFDPLRLSEGANKADYISQERLDIQREYRVYMIGGKVILPLARRSTKTVNNRARIVGLSDEKLSPDISKICQVVYRATKYDFVGIDIALAGDRHYLLEVNRSPQFKGYLRVGNENLAVNLFQYLRDKK